MHFIESIKKLARSIEIYQLNEVDIKEIIRQKYPKFATAAKSKIIDIILEICYSLQMFDHIKQDNGSRLESNVFAKVRDVRYLSLR